LTTMEYIDGVAVITLGAPRVCGELEDDGLDGLITQALERRSSAVIIDLRNLDCLREGEGHLASAYWKIVAQGNGILSFVNACESVQRKLFLCGLLRLFSLYVDLDEGLRRTKEAIASGPPEGQT